MGFTTKMKVPHDVVTVSVAGVVVEVDENGLVEVPTSCIEDLKCHGLEVAPAAPVKKVETKPTK